ncbi:hypothetical protein SUGI_0001420 [Cryptomeria japonica]|nr:hypothetical protein SUGI_0001420 [Cryptomeria japonica]
MDNPQNAESSAVESTKNGVENINIDPERSTDGTKQEKESASSKQNKKAERLEKRRLAAAAAAIAVEESDPLAGNYGDLPFEAVQSKEISGQIWTKVGDLTEEYKERRF